MLTRDQILACNDVQYEDIDIPAWGGKVRVRSLTGKELDELQASMIRGKGKNVSVNMTNTRARVCAMGIVDETGKPMFTEADIAALGDKNSGAIQTVYDAVQRLSGLTDQELDDTSKN